MSDILTGGGRVQASGYAFAGATTLTSPTDASTALPVGFTGLGLVSEDGVTRTIDRETTTVRDWAKRPVLTTEDSFGVSYEMTLMSATVATLREVFGARNVAESDGVITIRHRPGAMPDRFWVLEIASGEDGIREVIPSGQVVAVSETTFAASSPIQFTITIEAHADAGGDLARTLIEKGAFAAA